MAKKPTKRRKEAAAKLKDRAELDDILHELVKQGRVVGVTSSKLPPGDCLWIAVPDELVAPLKVDGSALAEEDALLLHEQQMPERLKKRLEIHALGLWRGFRQLELGPLVEKAAGTPAAEVVKMLAAREVDEAIRELLTDAIFDGFDMALERYAEQLKHVPEVAAWQRTRRDALDKGRSTQTQAKEAKYQRIRDTLTRLEAEGKDCTYAAVARECGCSPSTVERAINNRTVKRPRR